MFPIYEEANQSVEEVGTRIIDLAPDLGLGEKYSLGWCP